MKRRIVTFTILAGMVLLAACTGNDRLNGDPTPFGRGKAWAWIEHDVSGNPRAIGVTMTEDALSGLPNAYSELELPLPNGADAAPYENVVLGWDPLGHNPTAYAVPHFDFMFFFMTPEELGMVQPGPDSVPVEPRYRPPDYAGVLAEPAVGVHWGDTLAPELHGKPFGATFVYGFYRGDLSFVEPMVASSYFTSKLAFREAVKQPAAFRRRGYYPTSYVVKYDPKARTFTVALEGLTLQEAAK
jgi:hypothetical protein